MSTNLPPRSLPPEREPGALSPEEKKEQYNLDEIMKALRDKEREKDEKGEVVTRSDGTVARKVKRRRRRSEQTENAAPVKEKKRFLFKVVMAATLVLLLFLVGLALILIQNSKGHREKLELQASEWTGAEVEFKGLKRMPFSCSMQEANFVWDESSMIKSLELRKVFGDVQFRNYLGLRPSGVQIGGNSGELILGLPVGVAGESHSALGEEEFPFDFDQYFCDSLDVSFGGSAPIAFKGAGASLSSIGKEGYQLTLDQGTFQLKGWEDLPISSGLLRIKEGELNIKSLSLEHPTEDGAYGATTLVLSGKIPLELGAKASLDIKTKDFPLETLLGKRLALFFSGTTISSTGKVSFTVGDDEIDEIEVDFTAIAAKMSRLPFLENLHTLFPEQNFDLLEFREGVTNAPIKGTLKVRKEGVAIEGLEMAQKGKIKLRGSMVIGESGAIGGRFTIWINRFFLSSQERFKNSPLIAGTESTGFVKFDFRVDGTIEEPNDNFLEEIGVDSNSVRPIQENEEDTWDLLQK